MIAAPGLPTANFDDHLVDLAFNAYCDKDDRAEILAALDTYRLFDAVIAMMERGTRSAPSASLRSSAASIRCSMGSSIRVCIRMS